MLPRTVRKLSSNPITARLTAASSKLPISSTITTKHTHIHTKTQPQLQAKPANNTNNANRWFSAIPLPSFTAVTESIGMFTGNASLTTKHDRIMERVWEKRKQRLFRATNGILEKFKSKNINFQTVEIYIRKAGSFDESEDNAQREVHIALRGIAHTVVVLKCGDQSFLLDRVVEGIRLSELQMNASTQQIEKCNKFKPEEMIKLSTYNNINLSSQSIAEWIHEESQNQYNVIRNNCVQFSFYFHQQFLSGLKLKQLVNHFRQ